MSRKCLITAATTLLLTAAGLVDARPPTVQTDSYFSSPLISTSACSSVFEDVGCHAIVWKGLSQNVSYANEDFTDCWEITAVSDLANCLNGQEGDSFFFPGGNPPGSWVRSDYNTETELAVGTALYMYLWDSPAYVRFFSGYAAIEKVTFELLNGAPPVSFVCGFQAGQYPDDIDDDCAFVHENFSFVLSAVQVIDWSGGSGVRKTLSGTQFANEVFGNTWYVSDPPDDVDLERFNSYVKSTARAIGSRLLVRTEEGTLIPLDAFERSLRRERALER